MMQWGQSPLHLLGTALHPLQDIYAHMDYGKDQIILNNCILWPHSPDSNPFDIEVFDNPQYDLDANNGYEPIDSKSEFGSDRYKKTQTATQDVFQSFLKDIGLSLQGSHR